MNLSLLVGSSPDYFANLKQCSPCWTSQIFMGCLTNAAIPSLIECLESGRPCAPHWDSSNHVLVITGFSVITEKH